MRASPIAVVGLGCRFPGAGDPRAFWRLLRDGGNAVREVPPERWDLAQWYDPVPGTPGKMYSRHGGFLREVAGFDAAFFGISPREAEAIDPQQRLLLEVSWEALEAAGIAPDRLAGSPTGVFIGVSTSEYDQQVLYSDPVSIDIYSGTGAAPSLTAGRLSYTFGFRGPSLAVDTACSSSLVAVHLACQSLRQGECDLALAGGVSLMLTPQMTVYFSQARMLAADGRCKTFDAAADGYVRGEGCGVVALKRLADAERDGDSVLAVLLGSAVNHDGRSSGLTVPSAQAQRAVLRQSLAASGVSPAEVSYVEAHGTGTSLGDPIEARSLGAVLGEGRSAARPLLLGSVKTNVGHLEAAAGIAGLIKVVLALTEGEIPPQLHLRRLNSRLGLDAVPAEVVTRLRPWPEGGRRLAGVSAFGASGTNAHVVVEAAAPRPPRLEEAPSPRLLALSARSAEALSQLAGGYQAALAAGETAPEWFADACATAWTGRAHFEHRLALVAETPAEAARELAAWRRGEPAAVRSRAGAARAAAPQVAFLFTGQGCQYPGMGRELYESEPVFRQVVDRCSDLLDATPESGAAGSLVSVLYGEPGDGGTLDETAWLQPALFALEVALAELWRSWGLEPAAVMGHSVGEYTAACVAGALALDEGLRLVARRGRLVQDLTRRGAMAAVSGPAERVAAVVAELGGEVAIAAINAPLQTVIAGTPEGVAEATARLATAGLASEPLRSSQAFHSPLVEPVLAALERHAAAVPGAAPHLPMVSNLTGTWVGGNPLDAAHWRRHLREPVQFAAGMQALAERGLRTFVEIGPRATLLALARRCLPDPGCRWLASLRRGAERRQMLESAAALHVEGAVLDRSLMGSAGRRRVVLPTYPFQRRRHWPAARRDSAPQAAAPSTRWAPAGGHPLLGTRMWLAGSREVRFESQVELGVPAYLGDHRIGAAAVLPLAAYLEMAAAAGTVLHGAGSAVTDLAIDEAMVLREGEPHRLQTVLEPAGPLAVDGTSLQIYSRPCGGASASEVRWRLHARGRLGAAPPVPRPVALDELRRHCPAPLAAEQIYEALAGLGASYGPRFRGLAHIWRGPGRALARIELPRDVAAGAAGYGLHPVMLDCAFQLLAAAALAVTAGRPEPLPAYLPIGVESLHLAGRPGAAAWAYAVLRPGSEAAGNLAEVEVLGDARLYGEAGELLAEVTGVRVRRRAGGEGARARAERPAPAEQVELVWQRADLDTEPRGGSGPALPPPARVGAAVRRQRAGGAAEEPPDTAWRRRLDELCAGYALAGLRQLEWEPRPGLVTEEGSLAASLGVVAGQRQLFGRLLEILAEEGVLRRCAEGWRVAELPAWEEPPALWQEVSAALPAWREELQLLRACGERLGPVLRGRCDPLQVLFPDGSVELLASLYERGAVCRQCNEVVRQLVEGALAEWAAGGGGRLRVLEIGAGTGGTTAALLAAIGERLGLGVEVVYTDVSARFLAHGQEKLGARAGLAFRLLDIERPPWEQGLARAAYDVVVAANVLHATADLRRSLAHVRWLLADQGWLVLVEGSERQRLLDLTFGMTEGWWKCAGAEDGRRGYPLLPPEGWREALGAAGFGECEVVWAPPGWGQAVVVAGGRAGARAAASRGWLVLSDRGGVGRRLREVLEARGERCVEVYRQGEEKWEAAGLSGSLAIDAAAPEAYRRLLAAGREAGEGREEGPWHRVVHLWGLDAADVELATEAAVDAAAGAPDAASGAAADGTERLLGAVTDLTRSVLYTVQALAAEGGEGHPGRLWLVTRGAQAVGADGELPHPASAVLWGLGRVVALEHPELRCVLLDLDPHGEAGESEALAAELDAAVGEDQIGRRAGRRLAARLRRADPPAGAAGGAAAAGELVQLDRPASGTLEHLAFRPFTRRPPHRPAAGEVELRVRASGVNFRDLLCVLGMYDGRPGGECAGEVTALGEGVEGLAVGDRVLAIAEASFDSLVTAPAALVVPLPPAMGFAAGAAIPVAFTTAWYALRHLAPVAAGTRVLIHSAAGGAGLAAVRLALAAGAEVHATASPAKWPFLRRLGVASVASSRSLDFAGTLLAATGGSGVDVALSSLTGDFIPATLAVLRQGGTFIEIGRLGTWDRERMARERPDVTYLPIALDRLSREQPEVVGAILRAVVAELAAGRIEPLPRQVFPASEIASAFRRMEQGKHIGKLVVVTRPAADAPGDDGRLALRADATYWIAGGLGGLGRLLAAWLAERGARHLVLSGRSAETGQPAAALGLTLPAGCQVAVRRADVARSEEVAEVLQHVRAALPPLAGVFHLAGSLRDGVLAQQSWEAFAAVLPAKVAGAWNLHLQTRELGLELFVLFSSAAALLGSPGQGNHAAANAFLDALAHHRRATGLPALAVGWGAWSEVGAAARAMAGRAGWLDLGLLAPAEGLRQLERLLTAPTHAHSGVLPAGWPAAAERLGLGRTPLMAGLRDLAPEVAPSAALAERLAQAPAAARAEVLSDHVRELVARVLALPPGHPIPAAQGFMDLGMDSLTAMELRNLLQHSLGRTLPATLVFDHPTMARLAAHLAQLVLAPAAAAPPPAGGEADRLERILRLTDEEVGARLAAARVERR